MTILFCLAYRETVFYGMRIAECGIRTTYNLRNIPHQNFRKLYVVRIPHSAIRIPQNTPTQSWAPTVPATCGRESCLLSFFEQTLKSIVIISYRTVVTEYLGKATSMIYSQWLKWQSVAGGLKPRRRRRRGG